MTGTLAVRVDALGHSRFPLNNIVVDRRTAL
jgi:hypothetical protein